jgi:hypothetical protein
MGKEEIAGQTPQMVQLEEGGNMLGVLVANP